MPFAGNSDDDSVLGGDGDHVNPHTGELVSEADLEIARGMYANQDGPASVGFEQFLRDEYFGDSDDGGSSSNSNNTSALQTKVTLIQAKSCSNSGGWSSCGKGDCHCNAIVSGSSSSSSINSMIGFGSFKRKVTFETLMREHVQWTVNLLTGIVQNNPEGQRDAINSLLTNKKIWVSEMVARGVPEANAVRWYREGPENDGLGSGIFIEHSLAAKKVFERAKLDPAQQLSLDGPGRAAADKLYGENLDQVVTFWREQAGGLDIKGAWKSHLDCTVEYAVNLLRAKGDGDNAQFHLAVKTCLDQGSSLGILIDTRARFGARQTLANSVASAPERNLPVIASRRALPGDVPVIRSRRSTSTSASTNGDTSAMPVLEALRMNDIPVLESRRPVGVGTARKAVPVLESRTKKAPTHRRHQSLAQQSTGEDVSRIHVSFLDQFAAESELFGDRCCETRSSSSNSSSGSTLRPSSSSAPRLTSAASPLPGSSSNDARYNLRDTCPLLYAVSRIRPYANDVEAFSDALKDPTAIRGLAQELDGFVDAMEDGDNDTDEEGSLYSLVNFSKLSQMDRDAKVRFVAMVKLLSDAVNARGPAHVSAVLLEASFLDLFRGLPGALHSYLSDMSKRAGALDRLLLLVREDVGLMTDEIVRRMVASRKNVMIRSIELARTLSIFVEELNEATKATSGLARQGYEQVMKEFRTEFPDEIESRQPPQDNGIGVSVLRGFTSRSRVMNGLLDLTTDLAKETTETQRVTKTVPTARKIAQKTMRLFGYTEAVRSGRSRVLTGENARGIVALVALATTMLASVYWSTQLDRKELDAEVWPIIVRVRGL